MVVRAKRGYQTDPKYAWDIKKPISFFFDPAFRKILLSRSSRKFELLSAPSRIPVVRQAIEFWHNNSCVNFVEDPNGDSALRIFSVSFIFHFFSILNQELKGIERAF